MVDLISANVEIHSNKSDVDVEPLVNTIRAACFPKQFFKNNEELVETMEPVEYDNITGHNITRLSSIQRSLCSIGNGLIASHRVDIALNKLKKFVKEDESYLDSVSRINKDEQKKSSQSICDQSNMDTYELYPPECAPSASTMRSEYDRFNKEINDMYYELYTQPSEPIDLSSHGIHDTGSYNPKNKFHDELSKLLREKLKISKTFEFPASFERFKKPPLTYLKVLNLSEDDVDHILTYGIDDLVDVPNNGQFTENEMHLESENGEIEVNDIQAEMQVEEVEERNEETQAGDELPGFDSIVHPTENIVEEPQQDQVLALVQYRPLQRSDDMQQVSHQSSPERMYFFDEGHVSLSSASPRGHTLEPFQFRSIEGVAPQACNDGRDDEFSDDDVINSPKKLFCAPVESIPIITSPKAQANEVCSPQISVNTPDLGNSPCINLDINDESSFDSISPDASPISSDGLSHNDLLPPPEDTPETIQPIQRRNHRVNNELFSRNSLIGFARNEKYKKLPSKENPFRNVTTMIAKPIVRKKLPQENKNIRKKSVIEHSSAGNENNNIVTEPIQDDDLSSDVPMSTLSEFNMAMLQSSPVHNYDDGWTSSPNRAVEDVESRKPNINDLSIDDVIRGEPLPDISEELSIVKPVEEHSPQPVDNDDDILLDYPPLDSVLEYSSSSPRQEEEIEPMTEFKKYAHNNGFIKRIQQHTIGKVYDAVDGLCTKVQEGPVEMEQELDDASIKYMLRKSSAFAALIGVAGIYVSPYQDSDGKVYLKSVNDGPPEEVMSPEEIMADNERMNDYLNVTYTC